MLEDSSGNGGSSVAAYAAAAGIKAKIIVPAATSAAKVLQARAYGAEIELVGGTRDQVSDEAIRQSAQIPYASHNWHPSSCRARRPSPTRCGSRSGSPRPDNVVLVAGAGSNILGCDIAFSELLAAGPDRPPSPAPGGPARALGHHRRHGQRHGSGEPRAAASRRSREGASIAQPRPAPRDRRSDPPLGRCRHAVTEDRIAAAVRKLAARGLYAEPTSAVAAAALDRFLADGTIAPGETTVVVLTGSGLKSADLMSDVFAGADR